MVECPARPVVSDSILLERITWMRFALSRTGLPARPRGRTKRLVLEIAERIVAVEGVGGLRLKKIADEIGIQTPSLYKQFDGREAILRALSEKYVADLAIQFDFDELQDPLEVLTRGVRSIVELYALHPAWTRLQMRDYSSAEGVEALSRYTGGLETVTTEGPLKGFATRVREILQEGARIGVFREVLVADFISVLLGSLSFKIIWLGGRVPQKKEIERLQDMMEDIILRFVKP